MAGYIYLHLPKWTVDKDIATWSFPDADDSFIWACKLWFMHLLLRKAKP